MPLVRREAENLNTAFRDNRNLTKRGGGQVSIGEVSLDAPRPRRPARSSGLLVDGAIAAALAALLLGMSAGLGVVAVVAVPILVILLLSLLVEHLVLRRRHGYASIRATPSNPPGARNGRSDAGRWRR